MQKNPKPFVPHLLGFDGHSQTIAGIYLPSKWEPEYTVRRCVRVEKSDFLVIHDNCPLHWEPGDRVVVMLHGLGGCHKSGYMRRISAKLNERGIRTMRVDLRGFGASMYTCRGHSHVGRSDDLDLVLQDVGRCCPRSPITAIGFSFGGNIVCKLMAECGSDVQGGLDSAVAISPPVDLHRCAKNLSSGLNRFYDQYFVGRLKQMHWKRRRMVPNLIDLPIRKLPGRLLQFDDKMTAPLNGFADADEYYTMCSTISILDQIRVPMLMLTAANDPLIPVSMFDNVADNPAIQLEITRSGGHLGFFSRGGDYQDRRWLDWRILEWVGEIERLSLEDDTSRRRRRKRKKVSDEKESDVQISANS